MRLKSQHIGLKCPIQKCFMFLDILYWNDFPNDIAKNRQAFICQKVLFQMNYSAIYRTYYIKGFFSSSSNSETESPIFRKYLWSFWEKSKSPKWWWRRIQGRGQGILQTQQSKRWAHKVRKYLKSSMQFLNNCLW